MIRETCRINRKTLNPKNVKFKPTGGVNGGRGWIGDVKNF